METHDSLQKPERYLSIPLQILPIRKFRDAKKIQEVSMGRQRQAYWRSLIKFPAAWTICGYYSEEWLGPG